MSSFAIKYPYFILMFCLMVLVVGTATVTRMPVDLFPEINIPVVVVATFYSGMHPQQTEADITNSYERYFTLGSGINHIESRSLPGVSLIKIYFQPKPEDKADEAKPEVKADAAKPEDKADEAKPEDKDDVAKPEAKDKEQSNVTPQLVKRVRELYEELGREDVQTVPGWEKSDPATEKTKSPK